MMRMVVDDFVKSLMSFASVMGGFCWWSMVFVFLLWVEEQAKYSILSLCVQILEYREKSGLWRNRFAGDWLRELSVVVFVLTVACLLKCVRTSSLTLSLSLCVWKGRLEILLTGCEASKRYLTWWVSLSFFLWLKFGCWIGFCFKSLLCYVVGLSTEVVLVISSMLGFFVVVERLFVRWPKETYVEGTDCSREFPLWIHSQWKLLSWLCHWINSLDFSLTVRFSRCARGRVQFSWMIEMQKLQNCKQLELLEIWRMDEGKNCVFYWSILFSLSCCGVCVGGKPERGDKLGQGFLFLKRWPIRMWERQQKGVSNHEPKIHLILLLLRKKKPMQHKWRRRAFYQWHKTQILLMMQKKKRFCIQGEFRIQTLIHTQTLLMTLKKMCLPPPSCQLMSQQTPI